ncbi:MAG: phosphotransferase [Sulfitobacter sp.]
MTSRSDLKQAFVVMAGWAGADQSLVAGDASNRRYDRLRRADGNTAIVMDAPPDRGEDVWPFIKIAQHLTASGLSAPHILEADVEQGFLVIEDLGDALFNRVIDADSTLEMPLYIAAVDALIHMQATPLPALPDFGAQTLAPMIAPAMDWYHMGATGQSDVPAKTALTRIFEQLLTPLDHTTPVMVHRDFHAENLIWLPARAGVARVGLLDFQDAKSGHPAYDLVSVLQDARRDVSPKTVAAAMDHYIAKSRADRSEFSAAYAILGAQRNLRILGVFARLCMRDGKAHYVDLIPRVWDHLQTNLAHPALAPVAELLRKHLPPPTSETLEKLKSKCATYPNP